MPLARYRKMPNRGTRGLEDDHTVYPFRGNGELQNNPIQGGQSERIGETKEVKSAPYATPGTVAGDLETKVHDGARLLVNFNRGGVGNS